MFTFYLQYNWSRHWTVFSSSTLFWKIRLLRKYLTCDTPIILFMKKWKYMVTLFVCSADKRFKNQCGEQINTILNEKVSYTYRIQNSWKHVMVCFVQNSVFFFNGRIKASIEFNWYSWFSQWSSKILIPCIKMLFTVICMMLDTFLLNLMIPRDC